MSRARRAVRWAAGAGAAMLLGGAGVVWGREAYLAAKAGLASRLIESAFARHLEDGGVHPPWRWADTAPIARLDFPRLGVRRLVLTGGSGTSLAFGAGHLDGTARPNARGRSVVAGHRDGAFAFLGRVRRGETVRVRTFEGTRHYRVESAAVVDARDGRVSESSGGRSIALVTCWPFDAARETGKRFVVFAAEVAPHAALARAVQIDASGPRAARSQARALVQSR